MTRTAMVVSVVLLALVLPQAANSLSPDESTTGARLPRPTNDRAVPGTVWYQGFIADVGTGDPINGTVEIVAELFDAEVDGSSVWGPETHGGVNVVEGWFNIELGSTVSPLPGFDSPPYYLQLTVNGEPMNSRMKLGSAPTAIHAGAVDGGGGGGIGGGGDAGYIPVFTGGSAIGNSNMYETSGRLSIGTTTSDAKLHVENAGGLPVLKLVNTSTDHMFALLELDRQEDMNTSDGMLEITAEVNDDFDGHLIECYSRNGLTTNAIWTLYADGTVHHNGSQHTSGTTGYGVTAQCYADASGDGAAIYGQVLGAGANRIGVHGDADTSPYNQGYGGYFEGGRVGAYGEVYGTDTGDFMALWGLAHGSSPAVCYGVYGDAQGDVTNYGVYGTASGGTTNWAGYFDGDVNVTGTVTSNKAGFRIDHPDDPANAYLNHAYVASSEMKTVYDGTIILGADGRAAVELPSWFESINGNIRYQLTPIGGAAPDLHVAQKISDGRFVIAGGTPGLEVCWQVTGVRRDPEASEAFTLEERKTEAD